jgi:regulator of protease activity HflC (stomatin/prohibitin superfamily)
VDRLVIGSVFSLLTLALIVWGVTIAIAMVLAPYRAIRSGRREMELVGGWVKLVLWEPNEGVVILRNKAITEVLEDGEGGKKFIFPILGDEVKARFPLTTRLLEWEDARILTRESIQVKMKVAAWWKATSLREFALTIDTGIHVNESHRNVGLLEAAEHWLKTLTESTLRSIVSHASIATLVSSQASHYLRAASASPALPDTPDHQDPVKAIGGELQRELNLKLRDFGAVVTDCAIQEITFAPDIQAAIDRVWRAALLPAQSAHEAEARRIALEAEVGVLGPDAVRLAEVFKQLGGSTFFGLPGGVDALVSRMGAQFEEPTKRLPAAEGAKRE